MKPSKEELKKRQKEQMSFPSNTGPKWLIEHHGRVADELSFSHPEQAMFAACKLVGYKRNTRVIAPNGVRLDVFALSLVDGVRKKGNGR